MEARASTTPRVDREPASPQARLFATAEPFHPPAEPVARVFHLADRRRSQGRFARALALFGSTLPTASRLAVAALFVYTFLFNFSVVRGSSMTPAIHDGDRILIDHLSYLFGSVERGDIVVLKYPLDPSVDYIKRVIGLPGDEIWLRDGHVWVNGERLDEPYVTEIDPSTRQRHKVRPAHFFVLGDNRIRSSDSRDFGQVPSEYVRGKVEVRVWPPARFGRIDEFVERELALASRR